MAVSALGGVAVTPVAIADNGVCRDPNARAARRAAAAVEPAQRGRGGGACTGACSVTKRGCIAAE
ncbi:MAG: hypothetical protein NW202_12470, partial [Nitrospira sp.]|nr:hypothetical protein [Nitrospira sp.]